MKISEHHDDELQRSEISHIEDDLSHEEATEAETSDNQITILPQTPPDEEVAEAKTVVDDAEMPDPSTLDAQESVFVDEDQQSEEVDEERKPVQEKRWTRQKTYLLVAFGLVFLLAALLRFWGLGDKPYHHDESQHAYFSLQLMHNYEHYFDCFKPNDSCYTYNPLLHGPFQFHINALVYKISEIFGVPGEGATNYTARIAAATLGLLTVMLPFLLRSYLGTIGAWLACFFLAISPSMVYFSRFDREDSYFAFFTFLCVVAAVLYAQKRRGVWLVALAAAFVCAYATKEAAYLMLAVFASYAGAMLCWDLGRYFMPKLKDSDPIWLRAVLERLGGFIGLIIYGLIGGLLVLAIFPNLKQVSTFISTSDTNREIADAFVRNLEVGTLMALPAIGIILGAFAVVMLLLELFEILPYKQRWGWAKHVHPTKQRFLDLVATLSWVHWLCALIAGATVFTLLYSVFFTNYPMGIADGIWSGLYYWLEQQQVARGGQPWYYYLILIPLYEQIGVVFGIVGIIRCIAKPTRFRLFLVYWFLGNFFIYSWAGEKMPWLMIHMTMPLMVLAALGVEPSLRFIYTFFKRGREARKAVASDVVLPPRVKPRFQALKLSGSIAVVIITILLGIPTVNNMYQVSYIHQADAPHEMMIYVQSSNYVLDVMNKVDTIDKQYYGGNKEIPVGLTSGITWPFGWYTHTYPLTCFNYPAGCGQNITDRPVIIAGADDPGVAELMASGLYKYKQYPMRVQWDQGYMPPPCQATPQKACESQPYVGVGPAFWFTYGNEPLPANPQFDLGRSAQRVWDWWWQRKAIGAEDGGGSYNMILFIKSDIAVDP